MDTLAIKPKNKAEKNFTHYVPKNEL